MAAILVIEDDLTFSRILEGFLSRNGHKVVLASRGKDGLRTFSTQSFDLAIVDYRLPDLTGMDVLHEVRRMSATVPVVIMTSFNDIRTAVKAIKSGAFEYITKPVNPDELLMIVQQALARPRPDHDPVPEDEYVEGKSHAATELYKFIRLVAPTNMSVIIEGESGTGKENVARRIHQLSPSANGPFVAVDCGALSKELAGSELFGHVKGAFTGAVLDKVGQFEAANKGTIFLDEVGNLSYEVQVKLLRAIQERVIQPIGSNREVKVDVRIVTATNEDLAESVRRGEFREDLYHRLNEFKLNVPSVKERGTEDLYEFLDHFRRAANAELGKEVRAFHPQVLAVFEDYDWPGNLREMKNVVKRAVLLSHGDTITLDAIPEEMIESASRAKREKTPPVYDLKALQEVHEREMIVKTLQEVRHNKSKAARILNIDRKTLYLKMEKYGIQ